jgi:class 3 adenylate cyclase
VKGYGMWGGISVRSRPPRGEGEPFDDPAAEAMAYAQEVMERTLPRNRNLNRNDNARRRAPVPPLPHLPPPPIPGSPPAAAAAVAKSGLVTIVCTDIVGSTRYADTLGDQRWRAVLGTHNDLVRERLARHGGEEVKTSGDGFLLTFASPRAAVHFGVDLQAALADFRLAHPDTPLQVRIGVHAGEVERDGDDVIGRNVSLACRLCDVAAPGEVLVSGVVADLADSASDLAFGDGHQHQLAGIERPVTAHPATRR